MGLGIHVVLAAAAAHPTPAPTAPCGPSSPEARRFLPVRVDTSEVLHLEHKDKPHKGDGRMTSQLHGTAMTCLTTSSHFRCTCASSGNPVIYN